MTSQSDKIFPFPAPTFLFVHTINIYRAGGTTTTDARGKTVQRVAGAMPEVHVGYLTAPNESVENNAGSKREMIDAVCLVSKTIPVSVTDVIECHDPTLPPNLAGTYKVQQVRANLSHTRVLLRRIAAPWIDT